MQEAIPYFQKSHMCAYAQLGEMTRPGLLAGISRAASIHKRLLQHFRKRTESDEPNSMLAKNGRDLLPEFSSKSGWEKEIAPVGL